MATLIAAQVTSQGLLIPRTAIREWLDRGLEVVKEGERIVVRPRVVSQTEQGRVLRILEDAGLLVKPRWKPMSPPVSSAELEELSRKFSVGRPLSEVVIEERGERW